MVTITSTTNSNLHQSQTLIPENEVNLLRDASFSSYLNSNEESFIEKLSDSSRNLSTSISNKEDYPQMGEKTEEDGEIGVFEAEKYFNGEMEKESPRNYQQQKDQIAIETRRKRIQSYTPSVVSDSSWNSQSTLLQSSLRNSPRNRRNKARGKSLLAGLGCKCSCSDKNSVDIIDRSGEISYNKNAISGVVHGKTTTKKATNSGIDHNHSIQGHKFHEEPWISKDFYFQNPKNLEIELKSENSFPFTAVKSGLENQLFRMQLQQEDEEKPRKSLEVFGSPIFSKTGAKSLSFDKKLKKPSWNANPKMEEIDFSATYGGNYNDTESDASSDLFEIESLTGKAKPFLARQPSDATSGSVSPTNCYAPSEASIEWSVITATAAEYSVMSDCEDQGSVSTIKSPTKTSLASSNGRTKAIKEMQRGCHGMLLGCNSHKAVRVAGDANFITYEKASSNEHVCRGSDSCPQVRRIQAEMKPADFGLRNSQHAYATQPMQRSHSAHASQLVYI